MNLLADEGVDKPIVDLLRQNGYQVWYVAEMQPGISDDKVLDIANQQQVPLLTGDKDFGELIYRQKKISHGVILIRLTGMSSQMKAVIVLDALQRHQAALLGAFAVISRNSIRVRHS